MENEEYSTSKYFILSSIFWLVLFTSFGFIIAIKFFAPEFLGHTSFLTFGRVRPMHVNGVALGFLSTGLIGAAYYIIPRLSGTKLFNENLGKLTFVLWNFAIASGTVLLALGYTQAREYAEYIWIIDVIIIITLLLIGYNIFKTIQYRKERKLYGSTWYIMGTFLVFPIVYFTGGKKIFNLYCAQCHGVEGHGDGPASTYIKPEPANFTEANDDFTMLGQWFWKVSEGVETTNMPPWKYVLSEDDRWKVIYYVQKNFSDPDVFDAKWRV